MVEFERLMDENPTSIRRIIGGLGRSILGHPESLAEDAKRELLIRREARAVGSEPWNDDRTSQTRNTIIFMLGDQTLRTIIRLDRGFARMRRDVREWARPRT